ncbi:IS630 family transposase [Legionella sp. PATHC038]|uniref:IS630 family transposase n=1 Tax=Legionella sheltonii TaxID=2992041 RepID=UPI0022431F90|nr:IS630 family transposase [Legionella sp. PATHC038]MCW8398600.1 IS630 family transposase [Legionella sp. PATHC038]MCW8400515.1 IS630 family transposase [Legionella sp. PATHC038]
MIRISLKEAERSELTRLRLGRNTNIGERAYYVLLSDQGKSPPEIAKQLNRNIITIRLWLNRYVEKGIEGLKTKKASGRPAQKAPAIESRLKELLERSPQDYGYQESGWQINLLRDWFDKQGIRACEKTFAKALNKHGYVYKRFSKTMPENAPSPTEKKSKVAEIVTAIKQNTPNEMEVLFADESHFSNQPYVSRGWFKTGEKKQ